MAVERLRGNSHIRGLVRPYTVIAGARVLRADWRPNAVMYDWATIVATLLSQGNSAYRIGGMYLEYENVVTAETAVTAPTFDRSGGIAYYDSLADSPDADYLRVPLVANTVDSTDTDLFPGGNRLTFYAQSQASVGVGTHGKPFNDAAISKVYGGALVAIPDQNDRTRDLVLSRFYLDEADQVVKPATGQIGLAWRLVLE